jgi:hypothetical protein
MSRPTLLVGGLILGLTGPAFGDDSSQERMIKDLQGQVAELQATVAEMRAAQDPEQWLTERRADEIRALVHDVLADADLRASLLQDGTTAGWDKGFFLASADGKFRLQVGGQIQVRWVYNVQEKTAASDGDDNREGFEVRRAKLKFKGHLLDPTWKYNIVGAFDHDDSGGQGDFDLEDATITKDFENGFEVMFGQFKLPFLREELISSSKQLAADRSLVNEKFNQDRTVGVQLGYRGDQFRVFGAYSNGFKTKNTSAIFEDTEMALTARAEWLATGSWKQFGDFTSPRGSDTAFMMGAAIHYERQEFGTTSPVDGENDRVTWTVDASAEFDGANLFAAVIGNSLDDGMSFDQLGIVVQGGYYFTDEWEGFIRYEWGDLDDSSSAGPAGSLDPTVEDLNLVTVGVNRYFNKHNLKWTTDIGIGLDEVRGFETTGAGWRKDSSGEDGQVVIRSQFQLLF